MKFIIINGPNINMLGIREPGVYGNQTFSQLELFIKDVCKGENITADLFQSNHEGAIVDKIQSAYLNADGIIINPAAYTHTSVAILDALKAVALPCIEVHLSDISQREEFRKVSYTGMACIKTFYGEGFEGYKKAIIYLKHYVENMQDR